MAQKAIIFDWARTLYDSDAEQEFAESPRILAEFHQRGYRLALVSLVSVDGDASLSVREQQLARSPLRSFFEIIRITDQGGKDAALDEVVTLLNIPRANIIIVDDRMVRGIRYGHQHGHPTVWLQQGKFAGELPTSATGTPTFTINSLVKLLDIV